MMSIVNIQTEGGSSMGPERGMVLTGFDGPFGGGLILTEGPSEGLILTEFDEGEGAAEGRAG